MPLNQAIHRALRDKEQQLRVVLEMSQAGIFMTDSNKWTVSYANRRLAELFRYNLSELKGKALIDFIYPTDVEQVKISMHKLVTGELENLTTERRFLRRDGTDFYGEFSVYCLVRDNDSIQGMMFSVYDVSERLEAEQQLSRIESNYWEIFNASHDAMFVHDAYTGAIVDANKIVEKMFGYCREEILFMNAQDFSAVDSRGTFNESIRLIRKAVEVGPQSYEWMAKKKNGDSFWTETTYTASRIGGEGRVLAVVRDITDRKEIENRLQYLSAHDSLTGLYNRLYFETEFERLIKGRCYPISIINADLDGLKRINDRYGHGAGDELIKGAADLLGNVFREGDVVARFGGDEFVVLLLGADEEKAFTAIELIRAAETEVNRDRGDKPIRFSLGCASASQPEEADTLLSLADMRMYEDKALHKLSECSPNPDRLYDGQQSSGSGLQTFDS
jgi:diguanylate cyclase (GGDEF)-like protein/PAS domain S-box-containing protein